MTESPTLVPHPGPDLSFVERRSDRLVLRRFHLDDAPMLAAYRSDPEVACYQGWDAPVSLEWAEGFIRSLLDSHPDVSGEWFQFALEESATGNHIGDVATYVEPTSWTPGTVRVGVTLATSAQGQGYAREGLTLLFDYLFRDRGKHRVTAGCDPRNARVIALLERLGMRREAHHVSSYWDGHEWADDLVYAVLADEWVGQ